MQDGRLRYRFNCCIMFRDHPELLKLKSGAERSALILLNALDTLEE
jgi:hypothetical protein